MSQTYDQALQIGEVLNDQYRIDGILGEGGFGITYKAHDTQLDRTVVIKEFLPQEFAARSTDSKTVQARTNRNDDYQHGLNRFLDEAKALAKFQHPHIASVLAFFEANGTAYMTMLYSEGMDLGEWLKNRTPQLDEATILKIITPIVDGLVEVHKAGLLHRDIKPGNIYLRKTGGAMLIDFGAARMAMGEHSKSMSAIVSMGYAPPEQYMTRGQHGPATDLYAVGAVLYKLITGETPVESPERSHLIMDDQPDPLISCVDAGKGKVDDWLCELTDQLLKLKPKQRPQNAKDVLNALKNKAVVQEAVAPDDNKTRVVTDEQRFKASGAKKTKTQLTETSISTNTQSRGALKWVAGLAVIALLAGAGWFVIQGSQSTTTASEQQAESEPVKALEKGKAILYINSQPEGASVYLDGNNLGKTPYEGEQLSAGQHELKLVHSEYQDEIKTITLTDNIVVNETLKLKPATGNLSLFSQPKGAEIFIDNKATGQQTPSTVLNITAGARKITLKKDRYYPLEQSIKVEKGKTIRADLTLNGGDLVNYKGQWMSATDRDHQLEQVAENLRKQAKDKAKKGQLKTVKSLLSKAKNLVGKRPGDHTILALARKVQQQQQRIERLTGKMIAIPAGSFQMGSSSESDEEPIHQVSIKAFKLGRYEVTQKQWQAVMGNNPSNFIGCDNCPVEKVSWNDIQVFLKKLNQQTGQVFRLPTEAEWEYACRSSGKDQTYCGGNDVDAVAWYRENNNTKTKQAGQKQANSLGLYDMSGNVYEWTQDCWNDSYNGAPSKGQAWIKGKCQKRVLRGGSWSSNAYSARSTLRLWGAVAGRSSIHGFRLASSPDK